MQMSSSKKISCKGTLRQVFICLRPPPLLGFLFVVVGLAIFVRSESDQIQSIQLMQNMVSNRTLPTPSQPLYSLYFDTGKGGGGAR
jgi:hypothetical protein